MPSKQEKVLLSGFRRWPETAFTAEDLVVACWQDFPDDFGLQGHERQYPDSNIIYRYIMGQSSIVKKGKWLLQVGSKTYTISTLGAERALELLGANSSETGTAAVQRLRIDRSREAVLSRLLRSRAWQKYLSGEEIVFREACGFWGITPRSAGEEYGFARHELEAALALAEERINNAASGALVVPEANRTISTKGLEQLRSLDAHLQGRFADEVSAITGRIVDRGRLRDRQGQG